MKENSIKGVFKDGNGTAFIEKAANGKYFNNYGYDCNLKPKSPSSTGGFRTYGEAERALQKHRSGARRITRDKWQNLPGANK